MTGLDFAMVLGSDVSGRYGIWMKMRKVYICENITRMIWCAILYLMIEIDANANATLRTSQRLTEF